MPDDTGLFCFYVEQSQRNNLTVYVNGAEKPLYTESYSLPQMLSVCQVGPGDVVEIRFRCSAYQSGTVNISAAILNEEVFRQCHAHLAAAPLELTSFGNTAISGTIQCDRDGILYTSIPQNGNWMATVDGEPAQIVLIGDVMVGLNLSEGYHVIEFDYHNRAFAFGWKLSVVCLAALVICYFLLYQPKRLRKKGKFEK
jgi:uncharacterized membrane protein YfhO